MTVQIPSPEAHIVVKNSGVLPRPLNGIRRNSSSGKLAMFLGCAFIGIILVFLISSMIHMPYGPSEMNSAAKYAAPSWSHWFGCDNFGRDILSRVMKGTQTTVLISLSAICIAMILGGLLGSAAGFLPGLSDMLLMQVSDAVMAFPGILLALVFVAVFSPGIITIVLALGIVFAPGYARVIRSGIRQMKEREYILSARILGVKTPRILFVHMLPGLSVQLIPAIVIGIANAALAEAGMSYLGLGIQPPDASWGKMLADYQSDLFIAPWEVIFPSLFMIIFVLGLYFLSEALRIRLDKGGAKR
jgi:peptide/nickel transport system permease protein